MNKLRIIPLKNGYNVWTKQVGKSPVKILLLHGGPGMTHEYLEPFADFLPEDNIEVYFYDQLGSYHSDQPDDPSLWTVERFVEEVEEVRQALDLEDFYLYGFAWGGFLAIEYALKYQEHLKGLILSNTTLSISSYLEYINELRSYVPVEVRDKIVHYEASENYDHPEYIALLDEYFNNKYICRLDPWPDAVIKSFKKLNKQVYQALHGPNEFTLSEHHEERNRWEELKEIKIPTLVLGAKYDSTSIENQREIAKRIPDSNIHICLNGSHLSMWDDQVSYFGAIKRYVKEIEARNLTGN